MYPDLFSDFLSKGINYTLTSGKFPNKLKLANLTPVYKKGSRNEKGNYRPISILPVMSKVFERVIHSQLSEFFTDIFSDQQCGYRKGFNTTLSLLSLVETWKCANDQNKVFGAVLIDLSKAFDCMSHDLLIAKLYAYGLNSNATNVIIDYLKNRKQRTRVGTKYSDWCGIDTGVPQGSIYNSMVHYCSILTYAIFFTSFLIKKQ